MEKFNFDKKLAIERYMDLLRLITKCETRLDFENAMMKKYRTQVKLAMSYAKKYLGRIFLHIKTMRQDCPVKNLSF